MHDAACASRLTHVSLGEIRNQLMMQQPLLLALDSACLMSPSLYPYSMCLPWTAIAHTDTMSCPTSHPDFFSPMIMTGASAFRRSKMRTNPSLVPVAMKFPLPPTSATALTFAHYPRQPTSE